jgi:hypothetical protein
MSLKEEIKKRLAMKMEHPRSKQIRETNERVHKSMLKDKAKDRHERRHLGGKKTTLEERKKWVASIDNR